MSFPPDDWTTGESGGSNSYTDSGARMSTVLVLCILAPSWYKASGSGLETNIQITLR